MSLPKELVRFQAEETQAGAEFLTHKWPSGTLPCYGSVNLDQIGEVTASLKSVLTKPVFI